MRKVLATEQAALMSVLRQHEPELRQYRGVHYVDVGYKFQNNEPTDELAIRVHVFDKKPEIQLESAEILPADVDGVPLDVLQSNPQLQQSRDARFDPLVGGIAIRNTRHNFLGTLGVVVFDIASGAAMGLSNHHVMVAATGQAGDAIAQPATTNPNDVIGTLTRWNLGLDCAVCTLNASRTISVGIVDYPAGVGGAGIPVIGNRVSKSG